MARLPFRGWLHKSFLERNQIIIGLIGAGLILGGSSFALLLSSGAFASQYAVTADFANAAGVRPGDDVTVAGLKAGTIGDVQIKGGKVEIQLLVDSEVKLPSDSRAEIVVETLMGKKSVGLIAGGARDNLEDGDHITLDRTTTPIEVTDLANISTELLSKSDATALNEFIDSLTKITNGKRAQVTRLVGGLRDAATVVDLRSAQLSRLIDSLRVVVTTFAERDDTLVTMIHRLNLVLDNLNERRDDIETLLRATDSASHQVASLVGRNRKTLDETLSRLHTVLTVLDRHQTDLAGTIGYLENAVRGYSSVGYSQGVPNRWANIFVQSLGPVGVDALLGRCGELDEALTKLLGPDPRYRCSGNGQVIDLPGVASLPAPSGGGSAPGGGSSPASASGSDGSGEQNPLPVAQPKSPRKRALPSDVGDLVESVTGTAVGGLP